MLSIGVQDWDRCHEGGTGTREELFVELHEPLPPISHWHVLDSSPGCAAEGGIQNLGRPRSRQLKLSLTFLRPRTQRFALRLLNLGKEAALMFGVVLERH